MQPHQGLQDQRAQMMRLPPGTNPGGPITLGGMQPAGQGPMLLPVRPGMQQAPPGTILLPQQQQPHMLQMQPRPQQPVGAHAQGPGQMLQLSTPVNQGAAAGGALTIRPTVLQFSPQGQLMQQQPQQPPAPQQQQGAGPNAGLRTMVLGQQQHQQYQHQQFQQQQQQPQLVMQPAGQQMQIGQGPPQQLQQQMGGGPGPSPGGVQPAPPAGPTPRPMKRQAYTPLSGPPQKRPMVRNNRPWQGDQQQQGSGDYMQQDSTQQQQQPPPPKRQQQGDASAGGTPNAAAGAGGGGPRAGGGLRPAPKGPVHVLGDVQSLMYVIMNYVAQQNAKQPGREVGYDLCKFKGDFFDTYK